MLLVGLLLPPHTVRVLHPLLLGAPEQAAGRADRGRVGVSPPRPAHPTQGSLLPANGVKSISCGVKGPLPWAPGAPTHSLLLEFSVAPTSPEKDQALGMAWHLVEINKPSPG